MRPTDDNSENNRISPKTDVTPDIVTKINKYFDIHIFIAVIADSAD